MPARDEGRIIVGNQHRRFLGQFVNNIVSIGLSPPQIECVANSQIAQSSLRVGYALQQKGMQTIVSEWIRARHGLVYQHRQTTLVRQFYRERQPVIRFHPAIHLRPVQDVAGVLPWPGGIQLTDSVLHASEMMRDTPQPLQLKIHARVE
jgi:hypothetical protein